MIDAIPDRVEKLIHDLPKVELHVHLEGSLPPELLLALAEKHSVTGLPVDRAAMRDWYEFRDFPHFVDVYRAAVRVLNDEEDFAALASAVLGGLAEQNVRYAEVTVSLHEHLVRGIPAGVVFAGLEAGRIEAQRATGIVTRWLPDFAGDRGVDAGEETLTAVLADGPASVLGFGVGGMEVERDQFRALFDRARASGLKSFPHAGETHGPDRIWSAITALRADRIGHGIRAVDDPRLMDHLAESLLPVDVSPTSNLRTRAVSSLDRHPLPELLRRGVLVTLNSDDPADVRHHPVGRIPVGLSNGIERRRIGRPRPQFGDRLVCA